MGYSDYREKIMDVQVVLHKRRYLDKDRLELIIGSLYDMQ